MCGYKSEEKIAQELNSRRIKCTNICIVTTHTNVKSLIIMRKIIQPN